MSSARAVITRRKRTFSRVAMIRIFTTSIALLSLIGCGVTVKNLTAPSYPYEGRELLAKSPFIYPIDSPAAIGDRFTTPERGLYLEVKPKRLTSIQGVLVTVNGITHFMTKIAGPSRGGLYYFDAPCKCKERIEYFFTVKYGTLFGSGSVSLANANDPFQAHTRGWDHLYWYRVDSILHRDDMPEAPTVIRLDRQMGLSSATIVIENLRAERVALYGIKLVDAVGATHNDEYQLTGVPPNAGGFPQPPQSSYYLHCADALVFTVTHTGITEGAVGALSMHGVSEEDGDNVFGKLIYIVESNLSPP